jgi:hypothetical protein
MANEVTGKTLKYLQNGIEQAIKSITPDRNFTMLEATTTTTTSPGKESVAGRAKHTLKIDTDLLDVLGAEVATGTCVAGTRYLVTGGTITETVISATYATGRIFTSDGTGALSGTNKVKPLGAKITGKTLAVSIASSTFACMDADYTVKFDEFDSTTTATSVPNMDAVAGRAKCTSKFTALMYRTTANLITNAAPASVAVVLTFASGLTVTGSAVLHQMNITDEVNGICKVTYNAEWQGFPTEVGIGYLTMATSQSYQIIYETGTGTNKEDVGTIILFGKTVTSSVTGEAKITYDGVATGTYTPAVYS